MIGLALAHHGLGSRCQTTVNQRLSLRPSATANSPPSGRQQDARLGHFDTERRPYPRWRAVREGMPRLPRPQHRTKVCRKTTIDSRPKRLGIASATPAARSRPILAPGRPRRLFLNGRPAVPLSNRQAPARIASGRGGTEGGRGRQAWRPARSAAAMAVEPPRKGEGRGVVLPWRFPRCKLRRLAAGSSRASCWKCSRKPHRAIRATLCLLIRGIGSDHSF